MRAVQLKAFTQSPDSVTVSEIAQPSPQSGELLVKVEAAAINPSDIVNIKGGFPNTRLPRVIGRDFAGRVVAGPAHLLECEVWGAGGGDLGFTRDGTHAEFIALPEDAVALRPENIAPEDAAASGIPFVTAWAALVERARVVRNEWVIVSGAAGAVGGAAVQIAWYAGAHVIALIKDASEREKLDNAKVAAVAQSDRGDLADVVRDATAGKGAAIALNVVGAPIFEPLLTSLGRYGRMVVISGAAGRVLENFDLMHLYRQDYSLIGVNTANLTAGDSARMLTELHAAFASGAIQPVRAAQRYPLDRAPEAYSRAAGGDGKVVLIP